jgi:DNA modification methylase
MTYAATEPRMQEPRPSALGPCAGCDMDVRVGDCREVLRSLPDESVQCCVTSPPYWGLRDYGHADQIGQETTPELFVQTMVEVFREVRRVLKADGTCWLNLGDTYAGYHGNKNAEMPTSAVNGWTNGTNENLRTSSANRNGYKAKDLIGIPWMTALALRADGWYLRQDIIWAKPNPMPESVTDRCTKSHEYIFLLSKSERYYYNHEAIKEAATNRPPGNTKPTKSGREYNEAEGEHHRTSSNLHKIEAVENRNRRSVWNVPTSPYAQAHFATYPPDLIKPCIMAGTKPGDVVIDPFGGSGTTGQVALELGRKAILIELNPDYAKIIDQRTAITPGLALD